MNLENWLIILASLAAVAFILQCVSVWIVSRSVRQVLGRLEQQSRDLGEELGEITASVRQVTEGLKPLAQVAEDINKNAGLLSQMVRQRAQDLDRFVEELVRVGRDQASKIDYVVTDTVQKFEQVTEVIQKDVIQPALEISSFIKGVKAGLGYLFNRKGAAPRQSPSEEELFI